MSVLSTVIFANQTLPEGMSEGKVLEVIDVMGYNYLKVDENNTIRWVAIAKAPVVIGDTVGYDTKTVMKDFKSKQLDRVFDEIIFANEVYLPQKDQKFNTLKSTLARTVEKKEDKPVDPNIKPFVKKEFYTVEEVHLYRKELNGQTIKVKGKVYKVSRNIMKRDWVHLGDGTGNEQALTDDFVVTAEKCDLKAGQSVTATTKVVIDKDFGFGYFYPVLGEDSSFE
jgi:predicted heme/steroid binding protein